MNSNACCQSTFKQCQNLLNCNFSHSQFSHTLFLCFQFTCDHPYVLHGAPSVACNNGEWSPPVDAICTMDTERYVSERGYAKPDAEKGEYRSRYVTTVPSCKGKQHTITAYLKLLISLTSKQLLLFVFAWYNI